MLLCRHKPLHWYDSSNSVLSLKYAVDMNTNTPRSPGWWQGRVLQYGHGMGNKTTGNSMQPFELYIRFVKNDSSYRVQTPQTTTDLINMCNVWGLRFSQRRLWRVLLLGCSHCLLATLTARYKHCIPLTRCYIPKHWADIAVTLWSSGFRQYSFFRVAWTRQHTGPHLRDYTCATYSFLLALLLVSN
jgi:hypothetical protein